ncbi:MAG TPA: GAF domain-containing protein [Archaeoglobaceae archaeon]|nr:GAF domain-containing protein [Archaeoglobaceae archaeon]
MPKTNLSFAWIGFAENDEKKSVRPVAYSGYEGGYLDKLNLTWMDTDLGRCPTGTAIRTQKPIIAKNILKDSKFDPWRNEAIKRGYLSSIALPLISNRGVFGSLNIYADEEDAFGVGEIELLKKIAKNLSFGVETLRERAIREYIEKAKAQQQKRLKALWKIAKLVDADYQTLCDKVMTEVTSMTQSKYSFYGFLNEDESVMTIYSWSKDAMEDCQVQNKPIEFPVAKAGLWGDAVRERRTVIINDYINHPNRRELPDGHVPITRMMTVPVFRQNRIVALAGVANKSSEYTEEDAKQVNAFTTAIQTILDRKRVEERLKMSEEKYRTTFENTGTAILIFEEDTTISLVNSELKKLSGYKKEEVVGRSWTEFVHLDDLEKMLEYNRARMSGVKVAKNYEFRLIDKEGNIKYIYSTFESIPGTKKSVASLIDVTPIRRLNNLLKAISEINEIVARKNNRELMLKSVCDRLAMVYDVVFTSLKMNNNLIVIESKGVNIDVAEEVINQCHSISKAMEGEIVKIESDEQCNQCINPHKYVLFLPLIQDKNYGIITIHSISDFSADEEELLKELSSNIAFALSSYEVEESRKEAVEQLVTNLMQFDHSADRLRNPLAIIMSSLELRDEIGTEEVLKIINEQAVRMKNELDEMRREEVKTHNIIEKNATYNS